MGRAPIPYHLFVDNFYSIIYHISTLSKKELFRIKKTKTWAIFLTVILIFASASTVTVFSASSTSNWLTDVDEITNYAYSFAVVGDTQILLRYHPKKYTEMYDWITNNVEEKKIKYVIGLGDITDADTDTEWKLANATLKKLGETVPYSLVRGNHDGKTKYKKYFPYSEFGETVDGSYDNTMLNTYKKFTVGSVKYMLVNLDVSASDPVLNWANAITTHVYMNHNGLLIPKSSAYGANGGEEMWDKLVCKHENIVMVLCGHVSYSHIATTEMVGDNGNIITQIMIDPQGVDNDLGGVGLVAMLYFSEDGKKLDVRYYSTALNRYYSAKSQFSTTLDLACEEYDDPNKQLGDVELPIISKKPTAANPTPPIIIYNNNNNAYVSNNLSSVWWYVIPLCVIWVASVSIFIYIRKKR